MTGLAKLPAVFNLCSIARQFDTSVLSLAPSSSSSPSIDHSIVSSASDDNGNNQQGAAQVEFMSSDSDLPTWTAASSVEVTKKKLKVRRLTEDQGNLNKSSLTDSAEWYVVSRMSRTRFDSPSRDCHFLDRAIPFLHRSLLFHIPFISQTTNDQRGQTILTWMNISCQLVIGEN
jgi:hypothetical protein